MNTQTAGLNIWQVVKNTKFAYLKPCITVKSGQFLFLIDESKDVLIFKTEDNVTVMLPRNTRSAIKIF